jgi:Co/Zn/Cd efflux system component
MRLATKLVAGTLLSLGCYLTALGSWKLLSAETLPQDKAEVALAVAVFGLPVTGGGFWLMRREHRQWQRQQQARLRQIFFHLLEMNQGHISPIRFAIAAGLNGKAATAYLDGWAKEFSANYNISDEGNITYYFELNLHSRISDSV